MFLFSWRDGEQLYVSARNGEVVQHTTRETRLAAYIGAIPHWLYWTPLRKTGRQCDLVLHRAALVCAGLLGLLVGAWMFSPDRSYQHQGMPSRVPYMGHSAH